MFSKVRMRFLQERRFAVSQRERGGLGLPEIGCGHRTSRTIGFHPVRVGPKYRYSRARRFQRKRHPGEF
jgi:hypothetical protein